jgi:nucleotide-binding universal stress UspA family protein
MKAPETIIVGYDGRAESRDALALGVEIAAATDARLILAGVFPYGPERIGPEAFEAALTEDRGKLLDPVVSSLEGVEAEARAVGDRSPARALYRLADEHPDALVVLGSTHRGSIGRVVPGSVVERMLHGSPCPVAVAPRGLADSDPGLRVLAVAYDDSAEARAALELAGEIAVRASATVRVIGVLDPGVERPGAAGVIQQAAALARAGLRDAVHDAAASLPPEVRALPVICHGNAAVELAGQCEQGVDLLLMGSRGYGPLYRVLLGSVSSMMIGAARCPVIVVPGPRGAAAGSGVPAQRPSA